MAIPLTQVICGPGGIAKSAKSIKRKYPKSPRPPIKAAIQMAIALFLQITLFVGFIILFSFIYNQLLSNMKGHSRCHLFISPTYTSIFNKVSDNKGFIVRYLRCKNRSIKKPKIISKQLKHLFNK